MAHHEDGEFDLQDRHDRWVRAGRPVHDRYRIPLGDYEVYVGDELATVIEVINGTDYRDDIGAVTAPVLRFFDAKGNELGAVDDGSPWP